MANVYDPAFPTYDDEDDESSKTDLKMNSLNAKQVFQCDQKQTKSNVGFNGYIIESSTKSEILKENKSILVESEMFASDSMVEPKHKTLLSPSTAKDGEAMEKKNLNDDTFSNEIKDNFVESVTISSEIEMGSDVVISISADNQELVPIYAGSAHESDNELSCSIQDTENNRGCSPVIITSSDLLGSSVPKENLAISLVVNNCLLQKKDEDSTTFASNESTPTLLSHPSQHMVSDVTAEVSNTVDILNKTANSLNDAKIIMPKTDSTDSYFLPAFVEVGLTACCNLDDFASTLTIHSQPEESQKSLDETAVRRSSRIRSIAEKKKQKKSDGDKSFVKDALIVQDCDFVHNNQKILNSDNEKNSRFKSGKDSNLKFECDKDLPKRSLPKLGKKINKSDNSQSEGFKQQNKLENKSEKCIADNSEFSGRKHGDQVENSCKLSKQSDSNDIIRFQLIDIKDQSRTKQNSSSRRRERQAQNRAGNKLSGKVSSAVERCEKISNLNENCVDTACYVNISESLEFSKHKASVTRDLEDLCVTDDRIVEFKSHEKKEMEDHNILKPEKVKSRWRRNSELEHGELSGSSTTVTPEPIDTKSPEISRFKETLCPISEELAVQNELDEKNSFQEIKDNNLKGLPIYETIEGNIYLFERKRCKTKKEVRRMLCDCSLTSEEHERKVVGCEEDCLNRLLMIECGSRCATGDACSNRRFQKKKYVPTEPFKTEKKGWGLRVLEDVNAGGFVMEYVGEVLSHVEFKQRVKHYAREKCSHYYFMALKSDEIIDATNKGNLSRFINHSCNPNCETQKWTVNGELRIGFFTKRSMKAREELTFDYQFQRYGREAQKCHCESDNCHGYIGEAKQVSLDSYTTNKTISNKRKKSIEEKKRTVLEDLTLEDEVKKLCESGGLRNREETLSLARLMIHAENVHIRQQLLDLILKTNVVACLRLFLDYHGLSLLWSWMVDAVDLNLKSKIIKVLSILPIPNKTMLLDSKVINVVTKWSSQFPNHNAVLEKDSEVAESAHSSESPPSSQNMSQFDDQVNEPMHKKLKLSDTSDSETDVTTELHPQGDSQIQKTENADANSFSINECESVVACDVKINNLPLSQSLPSKASHAAAVVSNVGIAPRSDEESGDTMDEDDDKKYDTELTNVASSLLDSWCGLKEVFRIPRLEQQKRREDELEADRRGGESNKYWEIKSVESSKSRESKESFRDVETFCRDHIEVKEKKHREKGKEYETYQQEKVTVVVTESRDKKVYKKSSFCNSEDNHLRPRKTLLPTPPRMSKEERRHLFAMEVQQRDQEEALRRQQGESTTIDEYSSEETYAYSLSTYSQYYYGSSSFTNTYDQNATYHHKISPDCQGSVGISPLPSVMSPQTFPLPTESNSTIQQPIRPALLPTPNYIEPVAVNAPSTQYPDMSGTMMYSHPGMLFQPPPTQIPYLGAPPPTLSQPLPNGLLPSHSATLSGINQLQSVSALPNVTGINNVPAPVPHNVIPISEACTSSMSSTAIIHSSATATIAPLQTTACFSGQNSVSANPVTPGYLQSHTQFVNNQNQPVYYVPQSNSSSVINIGEQMAIQQPVIPLPSGIVHEESSSPQAKPLKLPLNWKTATDPDGNVYYYHAITRQTQWDPPTSDQVLDDNDVGTPTFDEPKPVYSMESRKKHFYKQSKKRSTTQAAADTSFAIEVAKKIKELFRTKMSSFIVQCLNPYRKPDCAVGRITSTEDFKHLARKLTHFVMSKELKHCKNVEELECNENVKHKAKDFVQKYMSKYGSLYRKEKLSSPADD